jgi:hypothetical protein
MMRAGDVDDMAECHVIQDGTLAVLGFASISVGL